MQRIDSGTPCPQSPLPTVSSAHLFRMPTVTDCGHTVPNRTHCPQSRVPTMSDLDKLFVYKRFRIE